MRSIIIKRDDGASCSTRQRCRSMTRDVSDVCGGPDLRRVFSSKARGMRDILRMAKPQRLDDLDRAERALSSRPAAQRDGGRLHRAQARQDGGQLSSCRSSSRCCADTYGVIVYQEQVLRIAQRARRLHAGRSRHPAQGDGEEESRRDAGAASTRFLTAPDQPRHQREESRADVRPDRAFRRLWASKGALDGLRTAGVSNGVSEGELSVALRRGAADHRIPEHRQSSRCILGRVARAGIPVLPPDINKSRLAFAVTPEGVRFGLRPSKSWAKARSRRSWRCVRRRARSTSLHGSAPTSICGS